MEGASPARLYATLVGGVLVIGGIIGFFYNSSFEVGSSIQADDALGLFSVNAWLNLVHLLTGALGLLLASYAARRYALGLGAAYLLICLLGFIHFGGGDTDSILKLVPVNTADNILHLILGVLGLAAGLATPTREGSVTAKPATA